jgi:hypothetical protein
MRHFTQTAGKNLQKFTEAAHRAMARRRRMC